MNTNYEDYTETLSSGALSIWNRIKSDLSETEFENLDLEALSLYCDAVNEFHKLQKIMLSGGSNSENVSNVKILARWAKIIGRLADKLGFTPKTRARKTKK